MSRPLLTRAAAVLVTLLLAGCGAATGSEELSDENSVEGQAEGAAISVPDVTQEDGADAQSTVETEELTVTLDPDRDPAGCIVEDQDPMGGASVEPDTDVTLTLDCRQIDWESQEGEDWDAYLSAYTDGFEEGCRALFSLSNSGLMFERGTSRTLGQHDQAECEGEAADPEEPPSDVPDTPEDVGGEQGIEAGCEAPFALALDDTLFEEGQLYTAQDCLGAAGTSRGPASAAPARPAPKRTRAASPALTSAVYRVGRAKWNSYRLERKLQASALFLANNPRDCRARGLTADQLLAEADEVLDGPGNGNFKANDILLSVCQFRP